MFVRRDDMVKVFVYLRIYVTFCLSNDIYQADVSTLILFTWSDEKYVYSFIVYPADDSGEKSGKKK